MDGLTQLLGQLRHIIRGHVAKDQAELLTTVARSNIQRPAREFLNHRTDAAQREIAGLVTERIVVALEVIHIDHAYGDGAALAQRTEPYAPQMLVESATVQQPGQAVAREHLADE